MTLTFRHATAVAAVFLGSLLAFDTAEALDAIGTAVAVDGQVSGSFAGQASSLAKGDGVVSNEVLRSQVASSGQISFVDQTKLFVGPSSVVVLDKFIFDQSGTASSATVNLSKGALRFISGRSPHDSFGVKTPLGSLGMRGTIVDVVIRPGQVFITDQIGPNQGAVVVTARNGTSLTLQPGQSAVLTRAGVTGASGVPDFAAACGGCALFGARGPLGTQPPDPAGMGSGGGGPGFGGSNSGQSSSGSSTSSDIRLKRDIVAVGRLANGIRLYRFRYRWSDKEYVGVMAQEVAKVVPDAVSRGADGYLRVNYAKLGLQLESWDEWLREHPGEASRAH